MVHKCVVAIRSCHCSSLASFLVWGGETSSRFTHQYWVEGGALQMRLQSIQLFLSGKWSPDHNRLWLLRRLAPTWEHFVQDIHPNFCTKATPTLHLKMGWKIATSSSAALVMISEGHIIKPLLYECCTNNKTHAKCTSHHKQNASLAKTRQILCRWRNLPRTLMGQWALHIWTIKCICWSQSTRQCIAEFPRSKALAIQGKLTQKTCHDSMMRHENPWYTIGPWLA